ncbi:lipoate--protein ligase family protein [Paenibacillus sp. J2TS4]|uniref:lipoate--protein ligase family protein n=1 Tax=Paenibacillus sp. J2TS4 TaxID=2807194 RepID=UPI001B14DCBF|nr:lipoate--protein ligase family protein [Paenibacillus sp. J2TS4]GIP32316.1 hypothetical protein J2TS4_15260 [Paenibacillus sp. J2TS4]
MNRIEEGASEVTSVEADWLQTVTVIHTKQEVNTASFPILLPFAWDEVMCRQVEELQGPLLHIWRHPRAFVVGLRDRKLPHAEQAMEWLRKQGYDTAVRNSGGAAVPLDAGVVNLSLVLPNPRGKMDFHSDFRFMVSLLRKVLSTWTDSIQDGEVAGSYCPGDYDLAIEGRKFCGIAQRRQTRGFVVQAFVVVEGKGEDRAAIARQFYQIASGGEERLAYPRVSEASMASLAELAGVPSAESFAAKALEVVKENGGTVIEGSADHLLNPEIEQAMMMLRTRYDR